MTDDLSRVLADIDSLLPPGAPSTPDYTGDGEDWEAEAMRWQPVQHDNHPEKPHPPVRQPYGVGPDFAQIVQRTSQAVYDLATYPHPDRYGVVTEHGWDGFEFFYPQVPTTPPRYSRLVERRWLHGDGPRLWPAVWFTLGRAVARDAIAAEREATVENLRHDAQRTGSNLQHLRGTYDRYQQAQGVIQARRHRDRPR